MERTRRAFDRSLSKEPGPKRSRLIDESAAPDRFSNGRAGFVQRPAVSNPGGGVSRAQKDRDSESSDSVRGPFQLQPGQPLYQELVSQYKTALAELTFNSKPIITNLTIIAGENLHAAKAIAGTVCANILEVPSDQKLPSLYLLDSIVKNIGRDYIKYFASKLPEVFCKAYRQVDPSVHPGMRHLFGTWKGVFPPHALQMIEKELGFTTTSNGSSSGITSRPEPQAQRPAHSIHVNPKYLEARQRLQSSRVGGASSDTSGGPVNSLEDVEPLGRTMSVSSGRSWADPYAKSVVHHSRDHATDLVRDRRSSAAFADAEYGSSDMLPHKKNGFGLKHGFESFAVHESTNLDTDIQLKQNISNRSSNWKNSEEEEYMWDEMNSISTVRSATDAPAKDHWANDNDYRLDFESHLSKPQNVNDIASRDYDEAFVDSMPMDLRSAGSGTRGPWSDKLHQPGNMLLGTGKNLSGYSEAYPSGLKSSQSTVGRTPQSHLGATHLGSQGFKSSTNAMPGPKVSGSEHRQVLEVAPSSIQARLHQRPPSPLSHNPSKLRGSNSVERGQSSIGPKDPRKTLGHKNTGYSDQFSESSLPLASQEAYQASTQRPKPQALRSMPAPVSSAQQRKHAPSVQPKNLKVSEFESSGLGQKLGVSQISGSESRSGNSSSDQSNQLTVDHPGQSFTSSSLDAALKSGNSLTSRLTKPSFQEAVPESTAVHTASNPVSSLISSLVAKGLISASKSESQLPALPEVPDLPPARDSEIATCSTTPVSPVPATRSKPLVHVRSDPSSQKPSAKDTDSLLASTKDSDSLPASKKSDSLPASTKSDSLPASTKSDSLPASTKSDSLPASTKSDSFPASTSNFEPRIGLEFKPGVIRRFHPDVISDLSDFPHRCSICGLGLKFRDRLDRHMQWHEQQGSEQNPSSKTSRSWYVDSAGWVDGIDHHREDSDMLGSSSEMLESSEQMVLADESQCACVLCGELFEDLYSRESNEWMFKGAVYLTSPSPESHEGIGPTNDTSLQGPIVHANCISEGSLRSLGMTPDVKLENDV